MSPFSRIGVVSRVDSPEAVRTAVELVDWLGRRGFTAALDEETALAGGHPPPYFVPEEGWHLVIALGGDGTLLAAARGLGGGAPILGVNLGRLGFLTEVSRSELYPVLVKVLDGEYSLEERSLLAVTLTRAEGGSTSYRVLNDAVVGKSVLSRIIDLAVSTAGGPLARFRADGLIVSTPTGSTAYNLSAGGPILDPSLPVMVLTPICPHTLTLRPLVVPDTTWIEVRLESKAEEVFLTFDGREGTPLTQHDRVRIERAPERVRLVRVRRRSFFDNLREKLRWGGLEDGKGGLV